MNLAPSTYIRYGVVFCRRLATRTSKPKKVKDADADEVASLVANCAVLTATATPPILSSYLAKPLAKPRKVNTAAAISSQEITSERLTTLRVSTSSQKPKKSKAADPVSSQSHTSSSVNTATASTTSPLKEQRVASSRSTSSSSKPKKSKATAVDPVASHVADNLVSDKAKTLAADAVNQITATSAVGSTAPTTIQPITSSSIANYLLNFPLCADPRTLEMASILAHDRVAEFGLKRYPSVGTVMRETQTPQQIFLLKRWREKKISELGSDAEFNLYVQRIKSEGERLHNCLRLFLSADTPETELPLVDSLRPLWASFRPVLDKISAVCAVETAVQHKPLGYTGIADCVAEIDGQLVVIDWKVSERQRVNLAQTYDTPIQIIGYIGAINAHFALNEAQKLYNNLSAPKDGQKEPPALFIPQRPIRHGLAVIGYRDGSPAHVHVMDEGVCQEYWQTWLQKVHIFWSKKLSSTSHTTAHNPQ